MLVSENKHSRILVVDDDWHVAEFVAFVLGSTGHGVRVAHDGDEALRIAAWFRPDIIFLDIILPDQDGWLVCAKLKLLPTSPAIVLVTGFAEEDSDRFASFVHADRLIRKPFSEEDVLQAVTELVPVN